MKVDNVNGRRNIKKFANSSYFECGELLKIAKLHLISCEYKKGNDIPVKEHKMQFQCYLPDNEYVVITCENGVRYVQSSVYAKTSPVLCSMASHSHL